MTPNDLEQIKQIITDAVNPINKRLGLIETRLDGIETRLDGMETRLDGMETRLDGMHHVQLVENAKAANSRAGYNSNLQHICMPNGLMPGIFPKSLAVLAVGGSELAAGTTAVSGWSRDDSLRCIMQYDPNYETDQERGGNADAERMARSSRRRRHHLAKLIGVTPAQMAMAAQMASYAGS